MFVVWQFSSNRDMDLASVPGNVYNPDKLFNSANKIRPMATNTP